MPENRNSMPAQEEIVNLDRPAKPPKRDLKLQKPAEGSLKLLRLLISYGVFVAAVGIVIYYITVAAKGEFHSDCCDTLFWANASHRSGKILSGSFHYACLLPFGGNLIMQPLIAVFGLSMKAHVIGMVIFFVLFALFLGLMLHESGFSLPQIFLSEAFILGMTLGSSKLREIFWGHIIYYSLGLIFLLMGAFLLMHAAKLFEKRRALMDGGRSGTVLIIRTAVTGALLLALMLFSSTDGISAMSIFTLPFLAAILLVHLTNGKNRIFSKSTGTVLGVLVILCVAVLGGIALGRHWAGDITAGYETAYSEYSSIYEWREHLLSLPHSWITLFGVKDMAHLPLASFDDKALLTESVKNLIRLIAAILLAVLPIIASVFYTKYPKDAAGKALRLWVWIHWAVSAIIMIGCVCGSLSGANWRLSPMAGTAVILTAMFLRWYLTRRNENGMRIVNTRIPALLAIPAVIAALFNFSDVAKMPKDSYTSNNNYAIEEYLEAKGLTYGFATFWNAGPVTVISDNTIRVRNVNVNEDGTVTPYQYQSEDEWFIPQPDQDTYFLLLDSSEYDRLIAAGNSLIREYKTAEAFPLPDGAYMYLFTYDHFIF
ncbi:MAG: hypothetical protein K6G90_09725 [Clostridia bacterium]|nr:hypothetical protein [Clostridia bacterium]